MVIDAVINGGWVIVADVEAVQLRASVMVTV
jgi:hypothetical protein